MPLDPHTYRSLAPKSGSYFGALLALFAIACVGLACAWQVEHAGHEITGMSNRVVWGLPHVFAIGLIVAASGALNVASMASVFGIARYKPWARVSVAWAIALLIGGLLILVLDLGRPDRLIIALTHWNFRSIFTWNIFLYNGFVLIGAVYLWMLLERRFNRYSAAVGAVAFAWRLILTTGTGSIFGWLVGRNALDSALLAPLFIAMSLVLGTATFVLLLALLQRWLREPVAQDTLQGLSALLGWFAIALGYFSIVHHLTNGYVAEHDDTQRALLGGSFGAIFWLGHIVFGTLIVAWLAFTGVPSMARSLWAAAIAVLGSVALLYTIVIGSQVVPQRLFPDKIVVASTFGDSGLAAYVPSVWEFGLGAGGVAVALLFFLLLIRVLPLHPRGAQQ